MRQIETKLGQERVGDFLGLERLDLIELLLRLDQGQLVQFGCQVAL